MRLSDAQEKDKEISVSGVGRDGVIDEVRKILGVRIVQGHYGHFQDFGIYSKGEGEPFEGLEERWNIVRLSLNYSDGKDETKPLGMKTETGKPVIYLIHLI